MVECESPQLDAVFKALSDANRRRILRSLRAGPSSVGELSAPLQVSLAASSKHNKLLERAALVQRKIQGRTHRCHLRGEAMAKAWHWLHYYQPFWTQRVDGLADAQTALQGQNHESCKGKRP